MKWTLLTIGFINTILLLAIAYGAINPKHETMAIMLHLTMATFPLLSGFTMAVCDDET